MVRSLFNAKLAKNSRLIRFDIGFNKLISYQCYIQNLMAVNESILIGAYNFLEVFLNLEARILPFRAESFPSAKLSTLIL